MRTTRRLAVIVLSVALPVTFTLVTAGAASAGPSQSSSAGGGDLRPAGMGFDGIGTNGGMPYN